MKLCLSCLAQPLELQIDGQHVDPSSRLLQIPEQPAGL